MCTATWLIAAHGYELFCNRDERRTRKLALPPRVGERDGVKYIAPMDGEFGGSWIGVNEFGLSLCLLNYYAPGAAVPAPAAPASRGLLLLSLLAHRAADAVARALGRSRLEAYPPFLLLALEPQRPPLLLAWDGGRLSSEANPAMPVTTSSFDTADVVARRQEMFATMTREGLNPAMLEAYHRSRDPSGDAYSVCMSREDALSVSFSRVRVGTDRVEFEYRPRLQEPGGFGEPVTVACPRGEGA